MGRIIYLGHASFLLKSNLFDVVLDPYANETVPNLRFPKGLVVDKVLCSHQHYDHNASNLVSIKPNPKVVAVVESLVPHDHEGGMKRGMNMIRMFDVDDYKVVHLGDTGCIPNPKQLEKFINCDVLLAPINGFFTINPKELKAIVNIIKPRIVIPMHYYMKQLNSGYPDQNMFEEFKKEFPNIKYLENYELDLDEYKDYQGALVFNTYLQ